MVTKFPKHIFSSPSHAFSYLIHTLPKNSSPIRNDGILSFGFSLPCVQGPFQSLGNAPAVHILDSPNIMFQDLKIFYCSQKRSNFNPEYASKSVISKAGPLLYIVRIVAYQFPRCLVEFLLEPPSATRKESKATVLDMH